MKPAGILLILITIWLMLKHQNIKVLYAHLLGITIAVELFVNVGYFAMIGTNEIMYSDVMVGLTSLLSLTIRRPNIYGQDTKSSNLTIKALILIIAITISCLLLIAMPFRCGEDVVISVFVFDQTDINSAIAFNGSTVLRFIRFVLFAICGIGIVKCNEGRTDLIRISIGYVYNFGVFVFIFLGFELVSKSIFKSMLSYNLTAMFFGKGGSTLSYLLNRGGIYTLQGLTREPNHLSTGLFSASIIVFLSDLSQKQKKVFTICSAIFILASGSFSGSFFGFMLLIILNSDNKGSFYKIATTILIVLVVILLIINNTNIPYINYIIQRISNFSSFLSNDFVLNNSTSDQTRVKGIMEALYLWRQRPLFGIGLGTFDTYSAIPSILCNIGVVGTFAWFAFVRAIFGNYLANRSMKVFICLIIAFTFSGSIGVMYSVFLPFIFYLLRDNKLLVYKTK